MHTTVASISPKLKELDDYHCAVVVCLAGMKSTQPALPVRQSVTVLERRSEHGDSSTPGNSRYQG